MNSRRKIDNRLIIIRDELIEKGVVKNKTDFADKLVSYSSVIGKIESGERNASFDVIIRLLDLCKDHFTPNYLFGFDNNEVDNIVFLTEATAGSSISNEQDSNGYRFKIPDLGGDLFAFKVKGDSMMPTLENGDILICNEVTDKSNLKNNQIYVISSNDGVNVKRVKIYKEKKAIIGMTLMSDNHKLHPPVEVDFSEGLHASPFYKLYKPLKRITENGLI